MSDEQELKLACLHQAGGNLDHAKSLFDWVSGSVRATPASEAPAVSAPNQDKPEQPFNYQHPSKYGTDVPRRCYLEELTPEERTIRDLVDAVERLGAHPLLTATVIQLMKAGESLADWVDIGLRDKAIAALTSEPETHTGDGGEEFLLDEGQQETSPVQSAHDLSVTREVIHLEWTPFSEIAPKVPMPRLGYELQKKYQLASDEWCFRYVPIITKQWFEKRVTQEGDLEIGVGAQISDPERPSVIAEQERVDPLLNPQSPSVDDEVRNQAVGEARCAVAGCEIHGTPPIGFTAWPGEYVGFASPPLASGQLVECWMGGVDYVGPVEVRDMDWTHATDPVLAYRLITDAERTSDESQATDQDRVEQTDLLLENQPGVSSQASSTEAAPANIPTNEGQNPWEPIRYCVDGMVIKRDTEFMCSDGVIRQRRIDGEVGFLELRMETFNEFEGEKTLAYRFTHSRDWKPAIDWAPYFGLTPPTHYGYRLETRWHEGGNQYRYVPTDQFIAHEGDWQDISKLDREELNDALLEGTAGRLGFGDGVGAGVMADAVLVSADTREAGVVAADISDAERTSDESQAETVNEQTLITDDIPSIPREEIPIGAAVETYTDSGIETVKISGTTYVVDDEPVAEASYAPINSEPASDALMWANGFEADAKAKAEPEQDKRPFWVFGKKELA